jgi:GntR family transcriptional regulator
MNTLHFHLNPHSGVPVYRQMIDQVKYYIASATLKPGDQLPSIRELAQTLTINPTTVVRVYMELEREGLVETRHGKGAFVTGGHRRMNSAQREQALRPLVRHLLVEGTQMGATADEVLRLVQEELAEMHRGEEPEPLKIPLLSRR